VHNLKELKDKVFKTLFDDSIYTGDSKNQKVLFLCPIKMPVEIKKQDCKTRFSGMWGLHNLWSLYYFLILNHLKFFSLTKP
jgi:hypothetical protein